MVELDQMLMKSVDNRKGSETVIAKEKGVEDRKTRSRRKESS